MRVAVVGSTGSGKTTIAKKLADSLEINNIELDELYWQPGWKETEISEFRNAVDKASSDAEWVVDGHYGRVRDIVWSRATHVIWMDYSFFVTFGRLLKRTLVRAVTRRELFNGNRESLRMSFLSGDSILIWMIKTYKRRKAQYPQLFQQPEYSHLEVMRIQSRRDEAAVLSQLINNKDVR